MEWLVDDFFSGIGGFSLGLEKAGMKTVSFTEIEDYPRKVLERRWPSITIHKDIKEVSGNELKGNLYCGGFPCQDISLEGDRKGLIGIHSSLWKEFKRIIKEGKPNAVIIENVANLRSKGLITVLNDLWEIGYDAEWHIISAGELGYPHLRERVWIVAYPDGTQLKRNSLSLRIQEKISLLSDIRRGKDKPGVARTLNGVPSQAHRLKCIGNAVVPIIPQIIGESLIEEWRESYE